MPLPWMSLRWTVSQRYLTAILLISLLTISFRSLFVSRAIHQAHVSFDYFELDVTPNGQVILGNLVDSEVDPGPDLKHKPLRPALGTHTLTLGGLLEVNPDGPHPIFQLIRDAKLEWEMKHARASKTLDEAVGEYRRRYRRAPPLGFDKWWDYAVKHNVQLPDEYDEIYQDIEPFWGIDPIELAHTQKELEAQPDIVTVEKTDALPQFKVVDTTLPLNRQNSLSRIDDILEPIREVELDIPPMRITFSPFDNPSMVSDWQIKSMALEAAANGTTLRHADMPPVKEGWIQACPLGSPARLHPPILPSQSNASLVPPPSPKTFIVSHLDAMNPCLNPSLLTSHGQFLSHKKGPFPRPTLVPRFSLCSTALHHDIRPPVPYGWDWNPDLDSDEASGGAFEGDVPWERKVDDRLSWRGRTTGIWASPKSLWRHGHRERLVTLASMIEGNISVLFTPENVGEDGEEVTPVGEPEAVRLAHVNPAWMDVAFVSGPIACDKGAGTCGEMEKMWEFRKVQGKREEGRYKFILDVDGNGWSGRFKRLITSNALVFKSTIYPEWYTSRIAPWVHYVPIQVSYADLYDAVAFFRAHDELAARIAKAGRDWSRRYWRKEDMTAYLYRLLLEYARVSSLDRASLDYVG